MARKWTKWAVGITGATAFAVTLGLIQMNSDTVKNFASTEFDPMDSVLAKDSLFTQTITKIKQSEFISMPYFVSYEYEKEGVTQQEFEDYLLAKEKVLSALDWGIDAVPVSQGTKPAPPTSNRKTRSSR